MMHKHFCQPFGYQPYGRGSCSWGLTLRMNLGPKLWFSHCLSRTSASSWEYWAERCWRKIFGWFSPYNAFLRECRLSNIGFFFFCSMSRTSYYFPKLFNSLPLLAPCYPQFADKEKQTNGWGDIFYTWCQIISKWHMVTHYDLPIPNQGSLFYLQSYYSFKTLMSGYYVLEHTGEKLNKKIKKQTNKQKKTNHNFMLSPSWPRKKTMSQI